MSKARQVDVIICPNLAGIGSHHVITLAEWRNRRKREMAMDNFLLWIDEAMKVAKPREVRK